MIRCLVVDDEPLALHILEDYISKMPFLQLVKATTNPIEALTMVQAAEADLVFLDVQMPELTGIQFLKIANGKAKVILTTAYPQYALEGYELDVVDYLLKPIAFDRFFKSVQKAQSIIQPVAAKPQVVMQAEPVQQDDFSTDFIFVKTEHKIQKVYLHDIMFIEGLKDYISIFTSAERIITLQGMKKMEDALPEKHFVRVHKSYIVALNKIDSIERSRIQIGDKIIPVGDTYRDEFFRMIENKNI
ncbi:MULTISPECIES: LytR/AlgR family response regulator transcription factor [Mucilaginibacter]|jgi:DNA-binding LytR/AlgR family response regulator|uniref:Response regulator transcription factor n=2 Tax=Mucilaginibacter TaxID=423349 RepID=A0AAE6JHZ6_9SPHI|nr:MULTISPECIES: LytTR family DNA-binding domain-containing protein [Mucilaginibacter]NVM64053.1 DNA-binding LytR/AlgR family response regulator [Mucilaginibacter sp. SG538B]QEM05951.1 response regulator transcription factor [Mucilaginibacter rubeus]QEM18531.1 response regulator transcription factor [Mucilaginibacter gossypii]QTE36508.1 LytTR family DNA-binding domain-containing protein [Mucilaginibacter gossypii]QTE44927.1 response regulator transcription factor [Mucilaginibacter rubeus]